MKKSMSSTKNATEAISKFDEVLDSLIVEPKLIMHLDLQAEGSPDFKLTVNDTVYYDQAITTDTESLIIEHDYDGKDISIDMLFHGKTETDTVIDEAGNIISDKKILIDRLIINNFDIYSKFHMEDSFIYDQVKYYNDQGDILKDANKMGFWLNNHRLNLTYTPPFYKWFIKHYAKSSFTMNMDFYRTDEGLANNVRKQADEAIELLKLLK